MLIPTITAEHLIQVDIRRLQPHPQNARKHPAKQLKRLAKNIEQFGFIIPIVIEESGQII